MKHYFKDMLDYIEVGAASGGTMTLLLSEVDMLLKILVSAATLVFIFIKIKYAIKKNKDETNNK